MPYVPMHVGKRYDRSNIGAESELVNKLRKVDDLRFIPTLITFEKDDKNGKISKSHRLN